MNKAQLAAALLLGAAAGVGGTQLLKPAEAKTSAPFVHAVDLRERAPDAGVTFAAWATRSLPDGGAQDVGSAFSCTPSATSRKDAVRLMKALATECEWGR